MRRHRKKSNRIKKKNYGLRLYGIFIMKSTSGERKKMLWPQIQFYEHLVLASPIPSSDIEIRVTLQIPTCWIWSGLGKIWLPNFSLHPKIRGWSELWHVMVPALPWYHLPDNLLDLGALRNSTLRRNLKLACNCRLFWNCCSLSLCV